MKEVTDSDCFQQAEGKENSGCCYDCSNFKGCRANAVHFLKHPKVPSERARKKIELTEGESLRLKENIEKWKVKTGQDPTLSGPTPWTLMDPGSGDPWRELVIFDANGCQVTTVGPLEDPTDMTLGNALAIVQAVNNYSQVTTENAYLVHENEDLKITAGQLGEENDTLKQAIFRLEKLDEKDLVDPFVIAKLMHANQEKVYVFAQKLSKFIRAMLQTNTPLPPLVGICEGEDEFITHPFNRNNARQTIGIINDYKLMSGVPGVVQCPPCSWINSEKWYHVHWYWFGLPVEKIINIFGEFPVFDNGSTSEFYKDLLNIRVFPEALSLAFGKTLTMDLTDHKSKRVIRCAFYRKLEDVEPGRR